NVSIWNITPTPKELLISKIVNLTAWAEFKVPPGTYNVTVHAEGSLQNETQYTINSYMEEEIECSNLHEKVTKIVVDNTTSISFTWTTGTVTIVARWINTSDDTQLNASALQDGYFQYRLKEGSTVIHDWTNISASGSGGNIYYVVNLTGVLFGGKVYTLEFRADASGYLSAFNQCSVSVALATPDIQVVGFAGKTFYWNASNIDLWVYVYDPENGFSVTEATVTYNIPGYLSGTLTHTGGGNYTGRPPDALPPGTYEIAFEVSCTNYSSQTESRILWIQNRPQT
nr:hypothetical protein [Candidatus Freyrarchaeum guaymaensis]